MRTVAFLTSLCVLLGGCARKSELDRTRAALAESQRKIEQLESERVPRAQYDIARASLRIADDRIATLEKNLNAAYDLMAAQQLPLPSETALATNATATPQPPATNLHLANGGYVVANGTHVYSPDSQLELGQNLQVTSPTGLMVTDTEQRVVGGDLAIKAKGMTMETNDGLLATQADGTVKFIGNTLTMKFDEKKAKPNQPPAATTPTLAPVPANPDKTLITTSTQ